ncbi:MAG: PHP domain-containing protein [Candidatus Eisenbacteria bacterium]|uniref:PHP domain-containing protein n=1 Tax=Eiseniibacteriota bacterium TaxID=2212470 RepID=A0A956NBZ1_UNCEI|nr:PHP domain-containing protein [Candidatus Eisenbacteria bacterium]MCB9463040.1 PHP domain-containing protein [Candidatus Eisenbacteria bacterium]
MTGRIDLHLHTLCSDGRLSPSELVRELASNGVTVAAITDHDTVDGWSEGHRAAEEMGIRLICGTELSVAHEGQDLHVLAYFVDPEDAEFRDVLEGMKRDRIRRMEEMVGRLVQLGIPARMEPVMERAGRGSVGRVHLAQELVERGWVRTYGDAFQHYLGDGAPACRPKTTLPLASSLAAIRAAGGVAVLAHPGIYDLDGLLEVMVPLGLEGLEVYHPSHSTEQVKAFEELADQWGLVKTGGSDYHGAREQELPPGSIDLGQEIVDELEARRPSARTRGDFA